MRPLISLLCALTAAVALAVKPLSLPAESPAPEPGYEDMALIKKRIEHSGPHRVEGVWRFPNTGATIAIERINDSSKLPGATTYKMVVVKSENRSIRPGSLMGILAPSANSSAFDAYIYNSVGRKSKLTAAKHFTLTLAEQDSRLVFKRVKAKYTLNLWRMLPYMFRFAVRKNDNTGEAPLGCVKIFPTPEVPAEPRYL